MTKIFPRVQLRAARGAAVGAVVPRHGEERPQRAAQRDQPEHAGQGVSSLTGNCLPPVSRSSVSDIEEKEYNIQVSFVYNHLKK